MSFLKDLVNNLRSFLVLLLSVGLSLTRQRLEVQIIFDELLLNRFEHIVEEVADQGPKELVAHSRDPFPQPCVIVQEVPLARDYAKRDSEVIVLTFDKFDQGVLNILSDIQDLISVELR